MTATGKAENLLNQIASGDRKAYEALFRMYYAPMVLYAHRLLKNKEESEDVVADLFCDLWGKRQHLQTVESERDYLFILLRNKIVDSLRRKQKHQRQELTDYVSEESIEDTIFEVELYKQLHDAIESLPKKCAEVLRLKMQGLNDREIAKEVGIEYETVRSHTKRGISLLRRKIENPYLLLFL